MNKLFSPFLVTVLGFALSVGVGLSLTWRELVPMLEAAAAAAAPAETGQSELKKKGWDFWTIEIENLANELKEERVRLRKQAEALDQRAARLAAEENEFAKIRANVEALRKEIGDRVGEMAVDEAKNLRSLAQTYTALTPRAAVVIIRELDDSTAVKILSLMKPDALGPIFEEMSKDSPGDGLLARRAAMLSEQLRLMKANKSSS
jgi:flagellar motility protein MotE (MotC chaperone)